MMELIPGIRNAARALIIRQDQILLLRKEGGGRGERYALPGGAQDPGENLRVALNRECEEEIGTAVDIGELLHVAEFFKLRDTQPPTRRHLVEFLFRCAVPGDYTPRNGYRPDKHQVEVVWADMEALAGLPIFPRYLSTCIPNSRGGDLTHYLGTFEDHATPEEH
jgi:ADP-ribose pyrophosphatase YjhB (NUDIX family)